MLEPNGLWNFKERCDINRFPYSEKRSLFNRGVAKIVFVSERRDTRKLFVYFIEF